MKVNDLNLHFSNLFFQKEVKIPAYFSPELSDFLTGGLVKKPDFRYTLEQMINHCWISKYNNSQQIDL